MIRIETTAEFDAEGRFTATGQSPTAVAPGPHRIVVFLDEPADTSPASDDAPVPQPSVLVREAGLLLINAEPQPNAEMNVRALMEAARDERAMHILGSVQS
jgi:hypothetical protein